MPTNTKRATLLATCGPNRSAWTDGEQVAITDSYETTWGEGVWPNGARWESSLAHWRRYFASVHAPNGWEQAGQAGQG